MTADVLQATFCSMRHIKGRKVYELIFEVAQENADHALAVLGGVPKSDDPVWAAIARLRLDAGPQSAASLPAAPSTPEAETQGRDKPRRSFLEMLRSQQTGIIRNDPRFWKWANVANAEEAAEFIRRRCGVESCADLDKYYSHPGAALKWDVLCTAYHAETGQMAEQR